MDTHPVGIIGAGSFGIALANIMAENQPVWLLARREEVMHCVNDERRHKGQDIHPQVRASLDMEALARRCDLIFPVVPSADFGEMIRRLAPLLSPAHMLIHATKGLDVALPPGQTLATMQTLEKEQVKTMSELIYEESVVRRIGCVAGPNLAREIAQGQPAATVVASHFDEVIRHGRAALHSSRFRVHASHDLLGIELAGVLKNIMAIGAGMLAGLGYGQNTRALLVSRGLAEMVVLGKKLGANPRAFLGLAGLGDLVATCSSPSSRNYTVGFRLAQGEKLADIIADMEEVAEGVKTIYIAQALSQRYHIPAPITEALYRVLHEQLDIQKGMQLLMEYPLLADVDFI